MAKAMDKDVRLDIGDADRYLSKVRGYCLEHAYTIATAESVTSGLIQAMLSQAKDAQLFFQGGITVYNNGQKTRHLDIEPINALNCDGVSEDIAVALSLSVSNKFCSQIGIGITGYASPVPERGILDLYAYMAISRNGTILVKKRMRSTKTDPPGVQLDYAYQTIKALANALK